jgi:hypothetical protein
MPVLAVPGPLAPAPPPVTVEVPEAWEALPPGADLLHVRGPGSAGDPVEVRLRSHTGPGGYAVTDLLDDLASSVREDGEVEPPFLVDLSGREWTARNVSWDEPGGAVVEVHLVVDVDGSGTEEADGSGTEAADGSGTEAADGGGDGFTRLLLVTGRVTGSRLEDDYDSLRSVLETVVVGGTP